MKESLGIGTLLKEIGNEAFRIVLSASIVFSTIPLAHAQQIIVDPTAPATKIIQNPGQSAPVINIATPNAGVSHNRFSSFNVTPDGVVLNNSTGAVGSTVLSADVAANPNLINVGPATVIVNEVTGNGASSLRGTTEVVGRPADVIIANPNGISCDGCTFATTPEPGASGTSRFSLTTGGVRLDQQDPILEVRQGTVTVGPRGLNADGAVGLYGRHVIVNGEIDTTRGSAPGSLVVSGGAQDVTLAETPSVEGKTTNVVKSSPFAVDASQLGAMKAGNITILGNESGLGVNTYGSITASGSVKLSSDGDLFYGSATVGQSNTDARNLDVSATGEVRQYGNVAVSGNVTIAADEGFTLYNERVLSAAGEASITSGELTLLVGEIDAAVISIDSQGRVVNNGFVFSDGDLDIVAGSAFENVREIATEYDIVVDPALNTYLAAYRLQLLAGGEAAETAQQMIARAETREVVEQHIQKGATVAGVDVTVAADGEQVKDDAGNVVAVTGGDVRNIGGAVVATDSLAIHARNEIRNDYLALFRKLGEEEGCPDGDCGTHLTFHAGELLSGGDLTLTTELGNIENRASDIAAAGNIALNAGQDVVNSLQSQADIDAAAFSADVTEQRVHIGPGVNVTQSCGGKDGGCSTVRYVVSNKTYNLTDTIHTEGRVLASGRISALFGNVDITAGRDFVSIGSEVSAGGDLFVDASNGQALFGSVTDVAHNFVRWSDPTVASTCSHWDKDGCQTYTPTTNWNTVTETDNRLVSATPVMVARNIDIVAKDDVTVIGGRFFAAESLDLVSTEGSVLVDSADLPDDIALVDTQQVNLVEVDGSLASETLGGSELGAAYLDFLRDSELLTSVHGLQQASTTADVHQALREVGAQSVVRLAEGLSPQQMAQIAADAVDAAQQTIATDLAAVDSQIATAQSALDAAVSVLLPLLDMAPEDRQAAIAAHNLALAQVRDDAIADAEADYQAALAASQAAYGHLLTTTQSYSYTCGKGDTCYGTQTVANTHYVNLKNAADAEALAVRDSAVASAVATYAAGEMSSPVAVIAALEATRDQAHLDAQNAYQTALAANQAQYGHLLTTRVSYVIGCDKGGCNYGYRTVTNTHYVNLKNAADAQALADRDGAIAQANATFASDEAAAVAASTTDADIQQRVADARADFEASTADLWTQRNDLLAGNAAQVAAANEAVATLMAFEAEMDNLRDRAVAEGSVVEGQESAAHSLARLGLLDETDPNTPQTATLAGDAAAQEAFINATTWRFRTGDALEQLTLGPRSVVSAEGDTRVVAGQDIYVAGASSVLATGDLNLNAGRRIGLLGAINTGLTLTTLTHDAFPVIGETLQQGTMLRDPYELEVVDDAVAEDIEGELAFAESTRRYQLTNTVVAATGNVTLSSGGDILNYGGTALAGETLVVTAETDIRNEALRQNFTLTSAHGCVSRACGRQGHDYRAAELMAGSSMLLGAGGDIINRGGVISAAGSLLAQAEGDIVNEALSSQYLYYYVKSGGWFSRKKQLLYRATIRRGEMSTEFGSLTLDAGNDIISRGSRFSAGGNISFASGNNIELHAVAEELRNYSKASGFGFFYFSSESVRWNEFDTALSDIEGRTIEMRSGNDIIGIGSSMMAAEDLSLDAGRNLVMDAHQNVRYIARSGWSIGISFAGSSILSSLIQADNGADIIESYMASNPTLAAVHGIATARNKWGTINGLLQLGSDALDDISAVANEAAAVGSSTEISFATVGDKFLARLDPLKGLRSGPLGSLFGGGSPSGTPSGDDFAEIEGDGGPESFDIASYLEGVTFRFSAWQSREEWTESHISRLMAGRDVMLAATQDLSLVGGTQVAAARDGLVYAGRDLMVTAVADWSRSTSSSWGVSLGLSSQGITIGADFANASAKSRLYTNAAITADGTLDLISGEDMSFSGANIAAQNIFIDAGQDLLVQSRQNVSSSRSNSFGFSFTITPGGGFMASFSAAFGNASRNYTDSPSSIIAGDELNIFTGGGTILLGALLNSETGNLKLDTATLLFDNFSDTEVSRSVSIGLSTNVFKSAVSLASSAASFGYSNTQGITYATIGAGEISLRDWADYDLSSLNRNADAMQQTLSHTEIDLRLPGINIARLIDQVDASAQLFEALASEVPEEIRDQGEVPTRLFRRMILNGATAEEARILATSDDFQLAVDVQSKLDGLVGKERVLGRDEVEILARYSGARVDADGFVTVPLDCQVLSSDAGCVARFNDLSQVKKDDLLAEPVGAERGYYARQIRSFIVACAEQNPELIRRFFEGYTDAQIKAVVEDMARDLAPAYGGRGFDAVTFTQGLNDYIALKDVNQAAAEDILQTAVQQSQTTFLNGEDPSGGLSGLGEGASFLIGGPVIAWARATTLFKGLFVKGVPDAAGSSSRIVPGGGLRAHENAGGHLIERHIGKTDASLSSRLSSQPNISAASSFPDRVTAERAVSSALDSNSSNIANFLGGTQNRLVIDHNVGVPVGNVMTRGSTVSTASSNVRVVLQRDPNMSIGYRIITGYPTP